LVFNGIIRPVASTSALTWIIGYISSDNHTISVPLDLKVTKDTIYIYTLYIHLYIKLKRPKSAKVTYARGRRTLVLIIIHGLLVFDGIIRPVASTSALTWTIGL
jgi:hypothetical protein